MLEESWFDPLVEFLEIVTEVRELGNLAATRRSWRVHGPDANGSYGGLQGLGGLEAVYSHGTAEEPSVVWQRLRIGATTENTERHRGGMGGELGAGDGLARQAARHHRVLLDGSAVL